MRIKIIHPPCIFLGWRVCGVLPRLLGNRCRDRQTGFHRVILDAPGT
jgi:hypothetical protein